MTRARAPLATRLVVVPASALLILSACSGSDSDSTPATSTTTSRPRAATTTSVATTTTSSAPDPETELVAAVRAFWDLYVELGGRTEAFDPIATRERLEERTTGRELQRLFDYFQSNSVAGYLVRGTVDVSPTVVSIDGTTARVRDCYDDATGLYRISDGSRVDTDDPRRHQVVMEFTLEEGVWKVASITDEGDGCTVGS